MDVPDDDGDDDKTNILPDLAMKRGDVMTDNQCKERTMSKELQALSGQKVRLVGWVHRIRDLGGVTFIALRDRTGIVQIVAEKSRLPQLSNEDCVEVTGTVKLDVRAPGGLEILAETFQIISATIEEPPIRINTRELDVTLETALNHRQLALRHPKVNAIFKVQAALLSGFRCYLDNEGFVEVHTPKIVAQGTEGGSELFSVQYFEQSAYLAQSPQFYKQALVGTSFERVYEVGHAYRAEEHNTSRHLNEYVSLDVEMAFIESAEDLMTLEEHLIRAMFDAVNQRCSSELQILGIEAGMPNLPFPRIALATAQELLNEKFNHKSPPGNLDPEGERLMTEFAKEHWNSPFVFITSYPKTKRPMYAKTLPNEPDITDSFDLLYKGIEVTTGGMRINNYHQLRGSIESRGLNPNDFEAYLANFAYGMPPHGGFAIGLERLTSRLIGLSNVREATLFPRDRYRLTP